VFAGLDLGRRLEGINPIEPTSRITIAMGRGNNRARKLGIVDLHQPLQKRTQEQLYRGREHIQTLGL
jgi:hypothetical protein